VEVQSEELVDFEVCESCEPCVARQLHEPSKQRVVGIQEGLLANGDVGPDVSFLKVDGPAWSNGPALELVSLHNLSDSAKEVRPAKEVGRVNRHIRFRHEDSDLSEFSDSMGDIGEEHGRNA